MDCLTNQEFELVAVLTVGTPPCAEICEPTISDVCMNKGLNTYSLLEA